LNRLNTLVNRHGGASVCLTPCRSAVGGRPGPTIRFNGLLAGSHDASIVLAGEAMATLTIRNVPEKVAKSLKTLARKNRRSMEQEVRELISEHVGERVSVLDQIQAAWGKQARRPSATEVEGWISAGRE
jgi:plasmid stability protein